MLLSIINWEDLNSADQATVLRRPAVAADQDIRDKVAGMIAEVKRGGDDALRAMTRQFDGAEIDSFRVSEAEIAEAAHQLTHEAIEAIDLAIANVRRFHEVQLAQPIAVDTMPGVRCERISHPIDSVGLYVPAGTAPLPSTAIMLAVPAVIAACPVRVLCTPPRPDGTADPAVLVAATRAGVTDIFKVGGAQAIAAMAYGTASIPKVRKVFGPGNAWVTSAKSLVSADPEGAAIDMPAGPSEVLVIADAKASAAFVAADLLSQAEHGEDSQVMLVTTSPDMATAVQAEVEAQLPNLARAEIAAGAMANSRAILVGNLAKAIDVSNRYAPEHLILQVESPRGLLPAIRNAGSVFLGPWTPEAVGDYCSGTNHVLPTYGYASTYSGLGVDQFQRQMTLQELTREGLAGLGGAVVTLANLEGLDGHAAAVTRRLGALR
ncbi:MAG TPA: histidinol dehydrogenase [Woeseiaceae bacterium]|jgi:histidinol dehydrogenase|nr:histidinol dehydrogenase [Woeseiaceae bacterium]